MGLLMGLLGPSKVTQGLSPFAPVIPLSSGTRVDSVSPHTGSALACSSSVRNPADLSASASSLILQDCRAFIRAVSGSGRWVRACPRATEDRRNTSDACDSHASIPFSWPKAILQWKVRGCTSPCFTDNANLHGRLPAAHWSANGQRGGDIEDERNAIGAEHNAPRPYLAMLKRSAGGGVAPRRASHRPPRSGRVDRHRRWGRAPG
jgi:hypothetical protein